ncbi:U7 snRNA-associated Sm-like protein LSm10 isoform X1 [Callorhinus ursinus]|uniref:U7 snRNA-associated Sm-like protein LSm10 n=1 Tax=Callorhinus ursinus TaxID=34884 RepID=A0A3Q7MY36_CALUR|nr:U7 snRNA-associated Sm-like protein LSm10 isoform X1 [Callorhinus ursinus]
MGPRPAISGLTENMLEITLLGTTSDLLSLKLRGEPSILQFNKSSASSLRCGRMAVSHSVKERTISENSLIILLQGLQGQVTTVDLRDESVARGRIDNVDAFMNIRLANVTYTDRWGHQVELDDLFVTGRNVRYVHIPDDVNITATIEQQLQVIHRVRNFGSKGQGRREFPSKKYK